MDSELAALGGGGVDRVIVATNRRRMIKSVQAHQDEDEDEAKRKPKRVRDDYVRSLSLCRDRHRDKEALLILSK